MSGIPNVHSPWRAKGTLAYQFDNHVKSEIAKFAKVIRDAKIEPQ